MKGKHPLRSNLMGIALKHSHLTGFLTAPFIYDRDERRMFESGGEGALAFANDRDSPESFEFDGVLSSPVHI